MKIGLLGNTEMLIPTMGYLAQQADLVGLGLWHKSAPLIEAQLRQAQVPDELIQVLTEEDWKDRLSEWIVQKQMDVLLIFGFPHAIPASTLVLPQYGCYNIHPGALPKYRGADPLFWQMVRGEQEIEICIHKMTKKLDAGALVQQSRFALNAMDNYGMLMKRVAFDTVQVVKGWLEGLKQDTLLEKEQGVLQGHHDARRPNASDLRISWEEQTAQEIINLVAATNPIYGGASCYFGPMEVRILDTDIIQFESEKAYKPGEVVYADALYGPVVACSDGQFIRLLLVHLAEGYFSGSKLFHLGIHQGHQLN